MIFCVCLYFFDYQCFFFLKTFLVCINTKYLQCEKMCKNCCIQSGNWHFMVIRERFLHRLLFFTSQLFFFLNNVRSLEMTAEESRGCTDIQPFCPSVCSSALCSETGLCPIPTSPLGTWGCGRLTPASVSPFMTLEGCRCRPHSNRDDWDKAPGQVGRWAVGSEYSRPCPSPGWIPCACF